MTDPLNRTFATFTGRLLMIGFGCVGQGVLPLLLRHIAMDRGQIRILDPSSEGESIARELGVTFIQTPVTKDNVEEILEAELGPGDFLLNVSVNVGSVDLIGWCQAHQVLYLDACIEPREGGYYDTTLSPALRTNYALREAARAQGGGTSPTAVLTHGVNPGLVSHFVKQALLNLSADQGRALSPPADREGWAALARGLGVRAIHIAERDTQTSPRHKERGEFVNTWSVEGFVGEGCQPAELGWGSHERHWPAGAHHHSFGCGAAIWLERPGAGTRVRSWTPLEGPYLGFLVTHGESISIADYLTVRGCSTVPPSITPITPAMTPSSRSTSWRGVAGASSPSGASSRRRTSTPAWTSWGCSSWGMPGGPTGTARASPTLRPSGWPPTTPPPACKPRPGSCPASSGP